jgi:hypothetical protein
MGYQFTLTLNRKINDDESTVLQEAGCVDASISTVPYPTGDDPDLIVTQFDFDDTTSPTLEAAITQALEAVSVVPDLSVATFSAPAQPNGMPPDEDDEWSDLDAPPALPTGNGAALATDAAEQPTDGESPATAEQQE